MNEASSLIQAAAHEDANIIFGAVLDEAMGDEVKITVIATGLRDQMPERRARMLNVEEAPLISVPVMSMDKWMNETGPAAEASTARFLSQIEEEEEEEPLINGSFFTSTPLSAAPEQVHVQAPVAAPVAAPAAAKAPGPVAVPPPTPAPIAVSRFPGHRRPERERAQQRERPQQRLQQRQWLSSSTKIWSRCRRQPSRSLPNWLRSLSTPCFPGNTVPILETVDAVRRLRTSTSPLPGAALFTEPGEEEQRDLDVPAFMRRLQF